MSETKTFRGLSLAEVEAKVRAELGDDAVVVRQREGLTGGVGGFFQKRLYEVDALPGASVPEAAVAPVAPQPPAAPAMPAPDFAETLKTALEPELAQSALEQQAAVQAAVQFVAEDLPATPKAAPQSSAAALAALFAQDQAPAPVEPEPEFEFDFPTVPAAPAEHEPVAFVEP